MKIIGIDLGTTNSCVYYLNDEGNPVLVIDKQGRRIFPSIVWSPAAGGEVVVGHKAKSRLGQSPPPVVAVKRKMGTTETVRLGDAEITPIQVSAHILSYAKSLVEEVTGDQVGGVVVTMPAYFDSAPKQDTCKAAIHAFFGGDEEIAQRRLALQLEPEAAAFAYTMEDPAERLRILVYDLGGGTFDVTILEKSPEAGLNVIKFGGNPHLGGDNIDDRIAAWILYLIRGGSPEILDRIIGSGLYPDDRRYTILQQVLTNDGTALHELHEEDRDLFIGPGQRFALELDRREPEDLIRIQKLKLLAEKAKMELTVSTEASIAQQSAFQDQAGELVDIDLVLSRADFNRLIDDMVASTIEETQRVVSESGLRIDQIDSILLVGGSSRMPIIGEELRRIFGRPVQMKDPDLIVARGAALCARAINPPPLPGQGEDRVVLEFPRQTPDTRFGLRGRLDKPLTACHVYLSCNGEDIADAPVEGERFQINDVPLIENTENLFHIEIVDENDEVYAESDIIIRQSAQPVAAPGRLSTKITKPIRLQGLRGFGPVFTEGELIPAVAHVECARATLDDFIVIPFYEGERFLDNLRIGPVDSSLPKGTIIDLTITMNEDYTVTAVGTVRTTKQSETVNFKIPPTEIPSPEQMDCDLEDVLEQLDNDITMVRDPNLRARLSSRRRRLEAEYRKARRGLEPDLHNLFTIVSELQKVLIEVRGAREFLDPPFEAFERLVNITRRLGQGLDQNSPIPRQDALDKINALERAGKDAWERQDAARWKTITGDLDKLKDDLEFASQGPLPDPRMFPPEMIQGELLAWIQRLRGKTGDSLTDHRFAAEFDRVEGMIRRVDLRYADEARSALFQIAQDQVIPLENRIERAIRETTGEVETDSRTTVDWLRTGSGSSTR